MSYYQSHPAPSYGRRDSSPDRGQSRSSSFSPPRGSSSQGDVAFRTANEDVFVAPEELQRFPSRQSLQACDTGSLCDTENVLSRAPWWDALAIVDRDLIAYYVDENGFLPAGCPGVSWTLLTSPGVAWCPSLNGAPLSWAYGVVSAHQGSVCRKCAHALR